LIAAEEWEHAAGHFFRMDEKIMRTTTSRRKTRRKTALGPGPVEDFEVRQS